MALEQGQQTQPWQVSVVGATMNDFLGKLFGILRSWLAERFLVYRPAAFEKAARLSGCALIAAFLAYLLANLDPGDWRGRGDTGFLIVSNMVVGLALIVIILRGLSGKRP